MWHSIQPEPRVWYRWRLNGAEAYLYRNGEEWRTVSVPVLFSALSPTADGPVNAEPPSACPVICTVARGVSVTLKPGMPKRPFLISARNTVRIFGGREARFDVDLPVSFRFEIDGGTTIGELNPFILSNTWFGDKTGGVLCYSLRTDLDPHCRDEVIEKPASAVSVRPRSLVRCSIHVRNEAKTPLDLKQLAVYTDLMGVYETPEGLVTDTVVVDGLSDGALKMSVTPSAGGLACLSAPRLAQNELLVRRGVNFLRSITGV